MYGPFMVFPHGAGVDVASLLMCRRPGRIPIANFIGVKLQSRKGEQHLFKWVDESWTEEKLMEEARKRSMEEEIEGRTMHSNDNPEVVEASKDRGCVGVIKFICPKIW
ncbi:unnamed protein product [Brassica oleracea var. botrytis]|uniref:BnaCnng38490D protein n=2 Tax=Brassica TaxID=3705 RepID=A0A078J5W0_BRANA|nr:BnaCnng38490D [Brassica napus]